MPWLSHRASLTVGLAGSLTGSSLLGGLLGLLFADAREQSHADLRVCLKFPITVCPPYLEVDRRVLLGGRVEHPCHRQEVAEKVHVMRVAGCSDSLMAEKSATCLTAAQDLRKVCQR